jgi:hypothetical protein
VTVQFGGESYFAPSSAPHSFTLSRLLALPGLFELG